MTTMVINTRDLADSIVEYNGFDKAKETIREIMKSFQEDGNISEYKLYQDVMQYIDGWKL